MDALHSIIIGQMEKGCKGRLQILLRIFCKHVPRYREPNRKFHVRFCLTLPFLNHFSTRHKAMNALVLLQDWFSSDSTTVLVIRKLLGLLLLYSAFSPFTGSPVIFTSMSPSSGGAETVHHPAFLRSEIHMAHVSQTTTSMTWFMLAMIAYPDKQRKCQEELEAVVGRSRMPTLADQASLPYICATIRELLRWRPVIPVGELFQQKWFKINHQPSRSRVPALYEQGDLQVLIWHVENINTGIQDDWYEGYFIPKGTLCLANIWYGVTG